MTSVAAGLVIYRITTKPGEKTNSRFDYIHLPLLGVISAAGALAGLWYQTSLRATEDALLTVVVSSVAASTILGTLLLHEKRRHSWSAISGKARPDWRARQASSPSRAMRPRRRTW